MSPAPIALFVYNRLWHARQTVEALQKNHLAAESELTVFSDGPRRPEDQPKVDALRAYLRTIGGFRMLTLVERQENRGLARSIIDGVTETLAAHGRIIVLEDDMVTSPFFLQYMNEGLELYKDEEKVISLTAYIYPVPSELPPSFFLRGADCWGWATWKRAWDLFEPDGSALLRRLESENLCRRFDFDGGFPYTRMLRDQIAGRNDSWAIRWYASAFLSNRLTLYPGRSLLHNIGNDGEGTHSSKSSRYDVRLADAMAPLEKLIPEENARARAQIADYFRRTRRVSPGSVIAGLVRKIFK